MKKETERRTVIAAVDDILFAAKIKETAKALGMVVVHFPRTLTALISLASDERPNLFIVDLHNARLNPVELATELKSSELLKAVPLLGFFSHVNVDLQRLAVQAGYDDVLPRSVFTRDLANILAGTNLNPQG